VDGPLFFADAGACTARILRMAAEAGASHVVVDLGATPTVDVDGADALTRMAGQLTAGGAKLLLARVAGERLDLLRRAGTLDAVGRQNVFPTVRAAVDHCARRD
jgi:MFS superfamily sulfate permease-like transporter